MPGKNEVTLTFAGDSDKLERTVKQVTGATGNLEDAFDRVGVAAKRSQDRMSGLGDSSDRVSKLIGKGGGDFRSYGSDLDGVGDGFNDLEDRAMGAGNILNGVNDMMTAQDPATYAMGLSDLAAGIRYTVVPTLQDFAKGTKGVVSQLGGMKGLLTGGAIIGGVAALAFGLKQIQDNRTQKNLAEINDQLDETGRLSDSVAEKMLFVAAETGNFDDMLQQVADVGGVKAAERLVEQAELLGANEETMRLMRAELANLKDEYDASAVAIDDFNTALEEQQQKQMALVDPLFNLITSTNELAAAKADEVAAQTALNDALTGSDPVAIAEAQRALEDAHIGVAEAAYGSTAAEETLMAQLATGQTTVAEMRGQIDQLEQSGRLSGDAAEYLRGQIDRLQSKEITLTANIWNATQGIGTVAERLAALDKSVQIQVAFEVYGTAELNRARALAGGYKGAIVPGYAAEGGLSWSSGPRGTDTVPMWLTPGEMVLNRGQQQNLFDAIDAGRLGGAAPQVTNVINVNVAGSIRSDREVVKLIRDEINRGGMRGVLR